MKDYLLDLIQHTYGLGVIDLVKVSGTDTETKITASSSDRNVIIYGDFKNPVADFVGVFGMPNLSKLKTILSFDEYDKDANIQLVRGTPSDPDAPTAIHFETKGRDFVNDYRLMSKNIVEDRVKTIIFNGVKWNVEFEPSVAGITRMKKQAQANNEEENFKINTDNGDLKIYFGDPSSHSGNFVFQQGVNGNISRGLEWPVKIFLSIMDLPGDKKVRIAGDKGVIEITVDSGISVWHYFLPAKA